MREIHILPLGMVRRDLVELLRAPLHTVFLAPVHIADIDLDLSGFYDDGRAQYNSTQMLISLKQRYAHALHPRGRKSRFGPKTLGIVAHDIFTPILTYVFGEAELGGDVAVVSYHRLENERYGLPSNPLLLRQRLIKEALHELGHTYGLVHCSDQNCVMHTSTYVEDIDVKGDMFCQPCRVLIGTE